MISGEIVVCGMQTDDRTYRILSDDKAEQRYAEETMDEGLILAPDFSPPPCTPNLLTWCPKLEGSGAPTAPIDLEALPEPYIEAQAQHE